MLTPSAPPNISGNSVTTLIVSIVAFHGHPQAAPGLRRLPRHACKPEQPLTVVGPPPRHGERPRDHAPVLVHHVQAGLRGGHGAWVPGEGAHPQRSPLPAQGTPPPAHAGGVAGTPHSLV